mmetsp:Transcript_17678/g.26778  ORF Transcript_17678/g.26778 Transcript_17678/m.26778 type:complete len:1179 (-) Transcript_17678:202-3738(-)
MTKNAGKSGKIRFDGVDVSAVVNQMQRELLGRRIINIYDGVSDSDSFLIKFDGDGKPFLFMESGVRFHTTTHQSSLQQEGMPSPFCSKLRKHLRGLRLERVTQLGNYDRVINLVFGSGELRHSLILELYARGNLILADSSYKILALLRSHEYEEVSVKVGEIYPVTYATSLGSTTEGLLGMTAEQALVWVKDEVNNHQQKQKNSGKSKKGSQLAIPLKAFLLKPSSGAYHYGPSLLEHCILCAGLDPNTRIGPDTVDDALSIGDWSELINSLNVEGNSKLKSIVSSEGSGHILYRINDAKSQKTSSRLEGLDHTDKVLQEFHPYILKQHEGRDILNYSSFAEAVDEFFAHLGGQKQALRAVAAEMVAQQRLDKIRNDQQQRILSLEREQDKLKKHAELIEIHADEVEKALNVINSALDTGMDWEALNMLVEVEQKNENPIALLIKKLTLDQDAIIISLPDTLIGEETTYTDVTVSLQESAHGNARDMFAKYRAFKEKSQKTLEASTKALKAAEANAQRQLAEAQKKSNITTIIQAARKPLWFEKFHWFITSDNYLVLGGRDAHQNEILVKRYLRPGDAYLHADVHGAASCILRAKRRRREDGRTEPLLLADQALREAGNFTICRSSAWASKMVTSSWWVESHQVSKTAPTGEYLSVGSFMVRGKKNFLPPTQLEMGLAVLFKLGDEDSIARHRNERRDFTLLDSSDFNTNAEHYIKGTNIENDTLKISSVQNETFNSRAQPGKGSNRSNNESHHDSQTSISVACTTNDNGSKGSPIEMKKQNPELETFNLKSSEETQNKGETISNDRQKKGLSVKERKLIKKYGSFEAAEKIIAEREAEEKLRKKAVKAPESSQNLEPQIRHKRGKKGKMKKAAKKYADQDDEDRELAFLALHGGEKKGKNKVSLNMKELSEEQQSAAAETKALLVKDAAHVAKDLPTSVRALLAKCVTTKLSEEEENVRWDKYDADVLENLKALDLSKQETAATRLLALKTTSRVDNFSASLAGIIRTIERYGHLNFFSEAEVNVDVRRKTKAEKEEEKKNWKETLAAEGIVNEEIDEDGIDDAVELGKLTGNPVENDSLLHAVPICAPYQTLSQYKFRVKLAPGNLKRGKAAKQCVDHFIHQNDNKEKNPHVERMRDLIKRLNDNDWVQVICSDVKISSAGAKKGIKSQKKKGKRK